MTVHACAQRFRGDKLVNAMIGIHRRRDCKGLGIAARFRCYQQVDEASRGCAGQPIPLQRVCKPNAGSGVVCHH